MPYKNKMTTKTKGGSFPDTYAYAVGQKDNFSGTTNHELLKKRGFSSLKILRRARAMTLEDLSEKTGISPSYLSRLEGGERRLNTDLLGKLSSVLACEPGDLLGHPPSMSATAVGLVDSSKGQAKDAYKRLAFEKDLPVYRLASDAAYCTSDDEPRRVDFNVAADWTYRPHELADLPKAFGIVLVDSGFSPRFEAGDTLFVHPSRPLSLGCLVFVTCNEDLADLGIFNGWAPDGLLLKPVNKVGAEGRLIQKAKLRNIYRIVGVRNA